MIQTDFETLVGSAIQASSDALMDLAELGNVAGSAVWTSSKSLMD